MAMIEVLGTGFGTEVPEREAQTVTATTIAQILGFLRELVRTVLHWASKLVAWAGENPLAASVFFMNLLIWFS